MPKSVFEVVPGLENAVEPGTRQNVEIEENRCQPGDINAYSGSYENILGEIRRDLFRKDSVIDAETAEKLLAGARKHFYNNIH